MDFLKSIKEKARKSKKTIVLPESLEKRNLEAAAATLKEGFADIILVGNKDEIAKAAKDAGGFDISGATIIDPKNYDRYDEMVNLLCEIRKKKGLTPEQAKKTLEDPLYFGVMLVKMGVADGMVSGATHPTSDVMRPALQIIKTKPGIKTASTFFVMCCDKKEFGDDGMLMFADCTLNQLPDSQQLAEIAVTTADSYAAFCDGEARVAMLSHSTKGSASHEIVDKVVNATKIAHELRPDVNLDGELQLDSAIVPSVGASKAPGSKVAGKANVLIFPDIDAGNIGYKLVQRFAGAEAYGPIIQGLAKPVNDLSRGCYANDIVAVIAMTAFEAQLIEK
ncbi:MAG: phosphate acetyltransferase [Clostridia bacterium]|nr:phosphate acetyltransferase [Clostridia bacterium]MCI1959600.1 phosphate acetyltransferase [Clostridia bacterium]MCI2000324.1 phosphate acetyltransferase [Clostridia bacterium]MCI2015504.1 phosphate acetyltransferase [Clostridia bacterium]